MKSTSVLARLRHTLTPATLEQSIAIYMLANFLLFFWRPFAAGIEMLYTNWGIQITVQSLQIAMGVFGVTLYLKRRVGSLAAVVLFAPIPLYGAALFFYFLGGERVGGLGWTGYLLATGLAYGWYIHRTRRELKAALQRGNT